MKYLFRKKAPIVNQMRSLIEMHCKDGELYFDAFTRGILKYYFDAHDVQIDRLRKKINVVTDTQLVQLPIGEQGIAGVLYGYLKNDKQSELYYTGLLQYHENNLQRLQTGMPLSA